MSDQNPNKTIMGIPGIKFNAPDGEDEAVEKPDTGRQTMFGLPSGVEGVVGEGEEEDDNLPTQIVSADSFSFDSEPAESEPETDLRSTAMGGLPSLGKRRSPTMPKEDAEQPRGPVGGFAKAFDGDEDEDGGASFATFGESRPVKHATLMGMSLEEVLAQEKESEKEGSGAGEGSSARSTMFSMPAPSLGEMQAALDDDAPGEESARSTMFSMPAPSFAGPGSAEVSEVSEGEDDDLPTAAIGVEQLQEFAEKEVDGLDNRKRLLAKLRSTRKQESKESETKGTMFGIPGINHERDESGSRAPITGVLKMPKRRAKDAGSGSDSSPLGGSSYTLPRPGDVKGEGAETPRFSLPSKEIDGNVGEEPEDSSSLVSDEFGKSLEASYGGQGSTPSPDFGAVAMGEVLPDRFGSQPVIQVGTPTSEPDVSIPDASLPDVSPVEEVSEPDDGSGIDPFAETQVAHVNDLEPFSFEVDESEPELDVVPSGSSEPSEPSGAPGEELAQDAQDVVAAEVTEDVTSAEEPKAQHKPRDPLPTPMFMGMDMEMFPGREDKVEPDPKEADSAPSFEAAPSAEPVRPAHESQSRLPVAPQANATGSMIQQAPAGLGVGSKGQRVLGGFASLPLIGATPLAFVLGGASGGSIVLAVAPAIMGALVLVLAAVGIDPKLRSAGLAVVGLLAGVVAAGAPLIGLHIVVALCAGVGALFALIGAAFPFLVGGSSS